MQQSNGYVISFAIGITVVIGILLTSAAVLLKPFQKAAIDLDMKKQILLAVTEVQPTDNVVEMYGKRISSEVIDAENNPFADIEAEKVEVAKEYKKDLSERKLPVYTYSTKENGEVEAYIFPIYGAGLWNTIWGYVALEADLSTIKGIKMAHAGETPGLGARITDAEIQDRYKGKKLFAESGEFKSVFMLKGEGRPADKLSDHEVDGMSGATLTAVGVNDMIDKYMNVCYKSYIESKKAGVQVPVDVVETVANDSIQIDSLGNPIVEDTVTNSVDTTETH